jgi:hypothetical protein
MLLHYHQNDLYDYHKLSLLFFPSGTVPVYLGDAAHLKSLLPHPKAAIFVDDFPNISELAKYLTYLTTNETAYEEHRAWRVGFNGDRNLLDKPLLQASWPCKVCSWAVDTVHKNPHIVHNSGTKCRRIGANGGDDKINSNTNISASTSSISTSSTHSASPLQLPRTIQSLNGKAIKGSARDVFLVVNNTRRPITTMDTFFGLKLRLADVKILPDNEVSAIPLGEPVILPGSPIPVAQHQPRVT